MLPMCYLEKFRPLKTQPLENPGVPERIRTSDPKIRNLVLYMSIGVYKSLCLSIIQELI